MSKPITWDAPEDRQFEYGVSKGVHYLKDDKGVYSKAQAWNGLINVTDKPTGADTTELYADGIEYAVLRANERYEASIEAYMYPEQFAVCDGSAEPVPGVRVGQQKRVPFGLCWRTEIGSAEDSTLGYKLHLAYGLTVSPSEQSHDTINDNIEASTFSWDAKGSPVPVSNLKPSAKITIDSRKVNADKLAALEDILYGSDDKDAYLPLPDEVFALVKAKTTGDDTPTNPETNPDEGNS